MLNLINQRQALVIFSPQNLQGQDVYDRLSANLKKVLKGQDEAIRWLLAAFFGGGHVLIEDVPGTGKTTLAKGLAASLDLEFKRIQFTPDLLPADILGVSVLDQQQQTFEFFPGPIFANLVLADEINRASPRTQAALLEAMAESQVTVEGVQQTLKLPFFVIATQNPADFEGTYPLPEAQMDRFALKFSLGFVPFADEVSILASQLGAHPLEQIQPCLSLTDISLCQKAIANVRVSATMKRYIVDVVAATRESSEIELGASPRGSIALMRLAQALACFDGYDFVTPDHIQEIAPPALAHRLVLSSQAEMAQRSPQALIAQILDQIPVPV